MYIITNEKMEALQIVRDNMIDPEDWIIDSYTISCLFSPCECKEIGIWFVGEGMCRRCEEIEYVDKDTLKWQMLRNALARVCKM